MRFISYAQNYEDVMLWRALQRVQDGFYIDVGANDPVKDSVTKAFYDRGWHGINVEPVAAHHQDLERDRPLDTNLRCALGDADGAIDLWECEIPGLATTDASVAEQHIVAGHRGAYHRVPVRTLASVCAEHAPAQIHFLKIDVEGGEERVLAGADFRRLRPWIVVVEATRPNSTEQKHGAWEHLLTGAGYRFAYADGLNRFYVADEHKELAQALAFPPNIFDGFVVAQQFNLEQQAEQLQATIARLDQQLREQAARAEAQALHAEARLQEFIARAARAEALASEHQAAAHAAGERAAQLLEMVQQLQRQLDDARRHIQDIFASRSWRVSKPIRWVGAWVRGMRGGDRAAAPAAAVAQAGRALAGPPVADELEQLNVVQPLPPRARRIYREIRRAAQSAKERR